MCGIAGFVTRGNTERAAEMVARMLPELARRGPDAQGVHTWPGVAFGHRRLAILDLSDLGKQPMVSEDGSVGLVFNGCIYNFLELRAELQRSGHTFKSECDTEVLLRGYREWGIVKLAKLCRGMFAFVIWDHTQRKLFLVRDRLGVKPLVYAQRNGEIGFASTVGALRATGLADTIDAESVLEFLEFGYVPGDRCIYSELQKVPPATIIEWHDGKISSECYWELPAIAEHSRVSFDDAVQQTERLIIESVRLRLISDVPIGALLSGGIDSTLVCWAMRELNADIKAFTVGTPGDQSDESSAAASIAKQLGIRHQVVTLADSKAPLGDLATAFSEPFACQSALGVMRVCAAVKPMATVLLTGDGGDDVYLGYPYFLNAWRAEKLAQKLPPVAGALWRAGRPLAKTIPQAKRAGNFLDYTLGGLGAYTQIRDGVPFYFEQGVVGENLAGLKLRQRQMPHSFTSARRLLSDVLDYHRRTEFLGEYMPKVDGGSMLHAIEARAPFLDQKLWEFAAALPASIRFHGGQLKAVLREIVRRRLGAEIADRPKQGFTVPAEKWIATRWRSSFDLLRGRTELENGGWVQRGSVERLVDQAVANESAPKQLWYLLVLENWLRHQRATAEIPDTLVCDVP